MLENSKSVLRHDTDFGFVLEDDSHFELYGMVGQGRFELFASIDCEQEELVEMVDEVVSEEDLDSYRKAKSLFF